MIEEAVTSVGRNKWPVPPKAVDLPIKEGIVHSEYVPVNASHYAPNKSDEVPVAGVKDQKGKARFSLIPFRALREVTEVLNNGATIKYSPNNWRTVEDKAAYVDGIVRHWTAYFQEGEEKDPESGLSALAHLACNVLFLLDDRIDKKDIPFDEYVKDLLTYSDYVKGQITEPYLGSVTKK